MRFYKNAVNTSINESDAESNAKSTILFCKLDTWVFFEHATCDDLKYRYRHIIYHKYNEF